MRLPLLGGSYVARSVIANAQRCVNLFPEINPKDSLVPLTHYQRSGLRALVTGAGGADNSVVRCLYRASNGNGYCVIGQNVYSIDTNWMLTLLGTVTAGLSNPCSMIDNGLSILLVDGSTDVGAARGWSIDLETNAFAQNLDNTGLFTGATRVDFIDTFILFNIPGTNRFGATGSDSLVPPDALNFASKTNYPDPIQTIIINRHEILLIGSLKTEIWFDAGGAVFPFAELPGAYIEHGTVAPYSVASTDVSTFWLVGDLQGAGWVGRLRGYDFKRVSNHALEYAIQQYTVDQLALAIGYTFQQYGHVFYVLHLPNETWVFDESTEMWHQEAWTNTVSGELERHRGNCCAFINGLNVCGDRLNGTIYHMDPSVYSDEVDGTAGPIDYIRTFPHIGGAIGPDGKPALIDGKRIEFKSFIADIEVGTTGLNANQKPPQLSLRWSDDRGKTFGQVVLQSAGVQGEYLTSPKWQGLGIARDRIFELGYSYAGPAALNGAWVDAKILDS